MTIFFIYYLVVFVPILWSYKLFFHANIFSNSNVVILPPGLQLSYNHHQQMTIPQQPTVKILKRPQKDNTANENADKPKVQVKSLEQV